MLSVRVLIYCYAECHYAECRYAESRGAKKSLLSFLGLLPKEVLRSRSCSTKTFHGRN
jgi:hypothetical protein